MAPKDIGFTARPFQPLTHLHIKNGVADGTRTRNVPSHSRECLPIPSQPPQNLDGDAGLEPARVGFKDPCLTNLANPQFKNGLSDRICTCIFSVPNRVRTYFRPRSDKISKTNQWAMCQGASLDLRSDRRRCTYGHTWTKTLWCPARESNPHPPKCAALKAAVSTNSTSGTLGTREETRTPTPCGVRF